MKDECLTEAMHEALEGFKTRNYWHSLTTEEKRVSIRSFIYGWRASIKAQSVPAPAEEPASEPGCLCGQINARHCPVHQEPLAVAQEAGALAAKLKEAEVRVNELEQQIGTMANRMLHFYGGKIREFEDKLGGE